MKYLETLLSIRDPAAHSHLRNRDKLVSWTEKAFAKKTKGIAKGQKGSATLMKVVNLFHFAISRIIAHLRISGRTMATAAPK